MKSRSKSFKRHLCAGSAVMIAAVLGSAGAITAFAEAVKYTVDKTHAQYVEASRAINDRIMQEGMVLLKNSNSALPLAKNSKVTVLGAGSYNTFWGEASANADGGGYTYITEALENASYSVNPNTEAVYKAKTSTEQIGGVSAPLDPAVSELDGIKSSFASYGDAAIITLSRSCVESFDLVDNKTELDALGLGLNAPHQLALYQNEKDLIEMAKANFGKVIVLLNTATIMQIPELVEEGGKYEADAIMYIGLPGQYGLKTVGSVLNGDVSPSGRTVDTWYSDFTKDPTYANSVNKLDEIDGTPSLEYEEGIYLGYKYYETAAVEGFIDYAEQVTFPFGYGLSYTSFEQQLVTSSISLSGKQFDDYIYIDVKVTNTGSAAGKEVVQIYNHAPYHENEIEKSEVVLVGFAKTETLAPGASATVSVPVRVGDLASYDYNDANGDGWFGYEIEADTYTLRLQRNSHELISGLDVAVSETIKFNNDGSLANGTNTAAATVFSQGDDYDTIALVSADNGGDFKVMSRADFEGTFPTSPTGSNSYKDGVPTRYAGVFTPDMDEEDDPWYVESVPADWTQGANTNYTLYDMAGVDYLSDAEITSGVWQGKTGKQAWTEFMNQLTWDEMKTLINSGSHMTVALASINKPKQTDVNGPEQLGDGTSWACANIMASTFNVELMEERGVAMANEGLYDGNNGWYGPTANINRTPFGGRNNIYYSEDSLITGKVASALVKGAQSRGLVAYVKHFALNEQEQERHGLATFVTEQALRETYLKAFEYAVKEGGALGIMQSLNRVGGVNGFGNYALDVTVLRDEWNFRGAVITDAYNQSYVRENMHQRTGGDFPLGSYILKLAGDWDGSKVTYNGVASPTQWTAVRNSAMHLLYMAANSSQVYNGYNIAAFTTQTVQGLENNKLTITLGQSFELNLGISTEILGTDKVEYTASALPAGLTLDKNTGVISGTPTEEGTTKVVVSIRVTNSGEEWITGSLSTLNIAVEEGEAAGGCGASGCAGVGSSVGAVIIAFLVVGGMTAGATIARRRKAQSEELDK